MKKELVVCILDEDVSILEPPLHLIRSHGFDVGSFLEMKQPDCMNLGVGTRAARTAGSQAMGRFYRSCSVQQGGEEKRRLLLAEGGRMSRRAF
jgi:hypothetical protein